MSQPLILYENISLRFSKKELYKGLNLGIAEGEKVRLQGPSGSGKSTLLKLLFGFRKPDSGSIYFEGSSLSAENVQKVRRRVGYVTQESTLGFGRVEDILKSVFNFRYNKVIPRDESRLGELLDYFEFTEEVLKQQTDELSGGERQRIAMIMPLLLNRTIFCLDEFTSSLDSGLKQRAADLFLSEPGYTVLFSSHDILDLSEYKISTIRLGEEQ